jgi:hypothetical protein
MRITCAYCGAKSEKPTGIVNRARNAGAPLYCDRECAGLGRRKNKSVEQLKAEKREYDARRRIELADEIRAAKREYHKRTYDPIEAAKKRKLRMPYHVEYCRRPEYRAKKKAYDHVYNAKRNYGPFWEIQLLTLDIRNAVLERQTDYEIRLAKGGLAKSQKRKRAYDQIVRSNPYREVPEIGAVGNLAQHQGRQDGTRSG